MNRTFLMLLILATMVGCSSTRPSPTARSATDIDPKTAEADYWYNKPATVSIKSRKFDYLWEAADRTARDYGFRIDRTDYREGLMTTLPLISKQAIELWRSDVATLRDLNESTLATVRRTIHFEFERLDDGTFRVSPKVLVERQSVPEHRVTNASQYRTAFSGGKETGRTDDNGKPLASAYWFSIGRDQALEQNLAESIRRKI